MHTDPVRRFVFLAVSGSLCEMCTGIWMVTYVRDVSIGFMEGINQYDLMRTAIGR